jgi:hypothetical protein
VSGFSDLLLLPVSALGAGLAPARRCAQAAWARAAVSAVAAGVQLESNCTWLEISWSSHSDYIREQSAHYGPASFHEFVDPVGAAMRSRGRELPIWDLEAGFAHTVPEGLAGRYLSEVYLKGLVTRQAAGITRSYSWGTADIGWPGGGHFSMFFGQNKEPLITQALTAAYMGLIGDAQFVTALGDDAAGQHLYHFRTAAGEDVLVGWTSHAEEVALAQSVLVSGRVLDEMGRPVAELVDAAVPLTPDLRYVVAAGSALPAAFAAEGD